MAVSTALRSGRVSAYKVQIHILFRLRLFPSLQPETLPVECHRRDNKRTILQAIQRRLIACRSIGAIDREVSTECDPIASASVGLSIQRCRCRRRQRSRSMPLQTRIPGRDMRDISKSLNLLLFGSRFQTRPSRSSWTRFEKPSERVFKQITNRQTSCW